MGRWASCNAFRATDLLLNPPHDCDVPGNSNTSGDNNGFGTGAHALAISPAGDSVYAASASDASVHLFNRAGDGKLTWNSCIGADSANAAVCQSGAMPDQALDGANTGFDRPEALAVSPDGKSVYAVTSNDDALLSFDRAADGTLMYRGCITGDSAVAPMGGPTHNGCVGLATVAAGDTGLDRPNDVVVSPEGDWIYVAAAGDAAVARFSRQPDGTVAYVDCVTADAAVAPAGQTGVNGCVGLDAAETGLTNDRGLALSPDGDSLYTAGGAGAVTFFDRPDDGTLVHEGCVTANSAIAAAGVTNASGCTGLPTSTSTAANTGLASVRKVVVSADGNSVYAIATDDASVIRIDRADDPPQARIDAGPDGPTADTTPTFEFSADEPNAVFECKIDSSVFGACTGVGTDTPGPLGDGAHTLAVRASDGFGDVDPDPATRAFTVDTTAPQTSFGGNPPRKLKSRHAKVRLRLRLKSTEPNSTFECAVDSAKFKSCSSPFKVKLKTKPGHGLRHKIKVRAADSLGNTDDAPAHLRVRAIRISRRA